MNQVSSRQVSSQSSCQQSLSAGPHFVARRPIGFAEFTVVLRGVAFNFHASASAAMCLFVSRGDGPHLITRFVLPGGGGGGD